MCFSAGASFGAGVVLTAIGVASIKKVQDPKQYLFAGIPLVFAFQQFSEGVVWLSLSYPEYSTYQKSATNIFLFIAQVIWPSLVPASILLLEKDGRKKIILLLLTGMGLILSSCAAYFLFSYQVNSKILGHHILYTLDYPAGLRVYGAILYFITTIIPPMISSVKKMWAVGLAILMSYIFTRIFLVEFTISVWCFFAAIISVVVYAIMRNVQFYFRKISLMEV